VAQDLLAFKPDMCNETFNLNSVRPLSELEADTEFMLQFE